MIGQFDVLTDWTTTKFCNFRCEYCFAVVKQQPNPALFSVKRVVQCFTNSGLCWLINMTGGEPFIAPNFVDLCKELTRNHYISINTNLSTKNVLSFADQIDPQKVAFIHCSLHFDERKRLGQLDNFIDKFNYLKQMGFNIFVSQVMFPSLLKRFSGISKLLRQEGIVVLPKIFRGTIGLKRYPREYTNSEREIIFQFYANAEESSAPTDHYQDPRLGMKFIHGDLSFKGLLCSAGKDYVRITEDGYVMRCQGSKVKLGNIFHGNIKLLKGAELCTAQTCPCPYLGLIYSEGNYRILKQDNIGDKVRIIAERGIGKVLNSFPKHPLIFSSVKWLKRMLP